jgi:hypothetical protein
LQKIRNWASVVCIHRFSSLERTRRDADCPSLPPPSSRSEGSKIWIRTLLVWSPCNPLKRHKTAKEIFGKAWTKTAWIWKSLQKSLEGRRGDCCRDSTNIA